MMAANFVFAIFYTGITPRLDELLQVLILSGESPAFLAMGIISGSFLHWLRSASAWWLYRCWLTARPM